MPHREIDLAGAQLTEDVLASASVVVVDHVLLTGSEIALLDGYVAAGGGLLAIGSSGVGLEEVLGLAEVAELPSQHGRLLEVVFEVPHPVTAGSYWMGPSLTSPPMPSSEIPAITQYYYTGNPARMPAYTARSAGADVLAGWFRAPSGPPDEVAWATQRLGDGILSRDLETGGRTVYSGALPGIWKDWNWVRTWRIFLISAVDWLAGERYLPALEPWPQGKRAAFSWTGDTEMEPDESSGTLVTMQDRVDAILDLFAVRSLDRFGSFFVVAKAGANPDVWSEGALENPTVVPALEAAGAETAGHGDVHDEFTTGDLAEQTTRLVTMVDILDSFLTEERTRGFRAPHLGIDSRYPDRITHTAAVDAGLDYLSNHLDIWDETTFPFWSGEIWEAPPTSPMDFVLFEQYALSDEDAAVIWKDKLDYVVSRRGMFTWLHHPWVIYRHLDVLEDVLDYALGSGDLWLARQDDIVDWWALRSGLTTTGASWEGGRIHLAVHNAGAGPAPDSSLRIKLPESFDAVPDVTISTGPASPLPGFLRDHGGLTYFVVLLPEIPATGELHLVIETRGLGLLVDGFETGDTQQWSAASP